MQKQHPLPELIKKCLPCIWGRFFVRFTDSPFLILRAAFPVFEFWVFSWHLHWICGLRTPLPRATAPLGDGFTCYWIANKCICCWSGSNARRLHNLKTKIALPGYIGFAAQFRTKFYYFLDSSKNDNTTHKKINEFFQNKTPVRIS